MSKIKTITALLAVVSILFFNSCKKDDESISKPVIILNELGYQNTKIGYIGSDFHIEAEIVAEGKIDKIIVEIHTEGTANWEFDSTYSGFSGLKNAEFHKHIDMPTNVSDTGSYHFHLIVVDMLGNQTVVESDIQIKKPDDTIAPVITITNSPTNHQVFSNGQTINISGLITDNLALGGVYIGLISSNQVLTDGEVNDGNTITLLHTHDFLNPLSHNFSTNLVVGASLDNNISPKPIIWSSGDYYILVKCKDAFGGNWIFSNHYNIKIN